MTSAAPAAPFSHATARLAGRFVVPAMSVPVWLSLWVAVVAAEILALRPLIVGGDTHPLYVIFRLVGGSFAVCGLIVWRSRPDSRSGTLMTATGFAFFLSPLLGQITTPAVQTLSWILPDLWLLFFVPLVLTILTGGRLRTRLDRAIVALVAAALACAPLELVFREYPGNVLLLRPDARTAEVLEVAQRLLILGAFAAVAVVTAVRFRAASRPGRRALLPAVAGAMSLALFGALIIRDRLHRSVDVEVLDWITAFWILTVPLAFLGGMLRSRLARGGLADLFRRIHDLQPAELQATLARVMGDPRLIVAYRQADGTYLDADGDAVTPPHPGGDRSAAPVDRDGERVALLIYDGSLDDDPELVEAVTAAATVALENRQLHAEAQASLAELRASRERIVTAGDAERRRIERNLHDGAQQRLVALAMQLSLIQRRIRADPSEAEQLVTSASDELARSLTELRELARGIHPSALDHGLDIALEALGMRAAVPTTVTVEPGPPLPEKIAFAVYLVVAEALTNVARYAHATSASVRAARADGCLVVEVADDGVGGADMGRGTGLRGLADRVETLGGTLRLRDAATGGTVVTAKLPVDA